MRIRTIEISAEVAAVLRAGDWAGTTFQLASGQLDRKLYEATDKVLRALGGKWKRQFGGHVFATDTKDALVAALESGLVVDQKKTLEQFFTPADLASRLADIAGIKSGMNVLEPSAGDGRLCAAALARGAAVTAIDIDEGLGFNLASAYSENPLFSICTADFMMWKPGQLPPFDRVIMNPPFSRGQDIAHVRRAFGFLTPGGKLAAIMSPHWTFAEDSASIQFREWLESDAPAHDWQPLPPGTFRESGTDVNCGILTIQKRA